MAKTFSTFLGANTPRGFVSLFDEMYNPYQSNCKAFIIKGGPGTGKSTLMKKIAAQAIKRDVDCELVYCSADPDSLDGVILDSLGIAIADGTSPHILEPKFPGASENIINTGDFWDKKKLFAQGDTIRRLSLEGSVYHRRSAAYLGAAGGVNSDSLRLTSKYIDKDKINSFALRFVSRELPRKKDSVPGRRYKRFISGITAKGLVFLDGTINALATRVIGVDDEYTLASCLLADAVGEMAIKNGYDVIFCHCPLKSELECEHIIIPEIRLALVTLKTAHKTNLQCDRIIHYKRFLRESMGDIATAIRLNRKLTRALVEEGINNLQRAKTVHDSLEKVYVDAMDFDALNKYCDNLTKDLF